MVGLINPTKYGEHFYEIYTKNMQRKNLKNQKRIKRKFKDKNPQLVGGDGVEIHQDSVNQQYESQMIRDRLVSLANFQISEIELEPNPSKFAIFYAIRSAVLEAKTKFLLFEADRSIKFFMKNKTTPCCLTCIGSCAASIDLDCPCHSLLLSKQSSNRQESDISDGAESDHDEEFENVKATAKVPLLVGAGLRSLFEIISEARQIQPILCTKALKALLDVIQGLPPESFKTEPDDLINPMYDLLLDLATKIPLNSANGEIWAATACTALISLCIVRGDTGKILKAVTSLLISGKNLTSQKIQIPVVLHSLQKTVICAALGKLDRPDFFTHGVPYNTILFEFPLNLNKGSANSVNSSPVIASDGSYIYLLENGALYKIGSGYNGTLKGYIYARNETFTRERNCWLGYSNGQIYYRRNSRRNADHLNVVNPDTLTITGMATLNLSLMRESSTFVLFTDEDSFNVICTTQDDSLISKRINIAQGHSNQNTPCFELPLQLSRKKFHTLGFACFEEELLNPLQMQKIQASFNTFEPKLPNNVEIQKILCGKDFGLVVDVNGRVYYYGKSSSLGLKSTGRSPSMKITELIIGKSSFITQVALGHDGIHALLVNDDGTVYFAGTARRGEDGEILKNRRQPKPSKPKKIAKIEGHVIIQAACNNGTSAFVTNTGKLIMFGKDTTHCDSSGLVTDLSEHHITKVALGKAHCVVLNAKGQVFTFGLNNKGQCGRPFSKQKDSIPFVPSGIVEHKPLNPDSKSSKWDFTSLCDYDDHTVVQGQCRVCVLCRECTGYNNSCISNIHLPLSDKIPGTACVCGLGDSGCSKCGLCTSCISKQEHATDLKELKAVKNLLPHKKDKSGNLEENNHPINDLEKDPPRVAPLPPQLLSIHNNSSPVIQIACGLHHTILLTLSGEVYTFGSNQYGQLGTGDLQPINGPFRINLNVSIVQIDAGSNHTVLLSNKGVVYTFGNFQKGQLGRLPIDVNQKNMSDESKNSNAYKESVVNNIMNQRQRYLWNCSPGAVSGIGINYGKRATWIGASGDQTFIKINESLITSQMLSKIHVVANKKSILLLPTIPMGFQTLSINRRDGSCKAHFQNQIDFSYPISKKLYKPEPEINQNIALNCTHDDNYASVSHYQSAESISFPKHRKNGIFDCEESNSMSSSRHYSSSSSINSTFLEKQDTYFGFALDPHYNVLWVYNSELKKFSCYNVLLNEIDGKGTDNSIYRSILSPELALPDCTVTNVSRLRSSLNLLACLDILTTAQDSIPNCFEDPAPKEQAFTKETQTNDYQIVSRFENFGGGWGYSGHSVEAIRFSADTDVILYGFGIYGGRGEYTCKLKLFDLGVDGGGYEKDGILISETKEIPYECPARAKFHIILPKPVNAVAGRWYLVCARIAGPSSDCGSCGQSLITTEDQVVFSFKTSKKANNGTDVNSGQIPAVLYRLVTHENNQSPTTPEIEPVHKISKAFAGTVTKECFESLVSLLQWSWDMLKLNLKSMAKKEEDLQIKDTTEYLRYINKFCLRLLRKYTNDIYPKSPAVFSESCETYQQRHLGSIGSTKDKKDDKLCKSNILSNAAIKSMRCSEQGEHFGRKSNLENLQLAECVGNVRALLINMLCDDILLDSIIPEGDLAVRDIMDECHYSFVSCFDAFYPTSSLKWNCLCDLLLQMDHGTFHKRFLSAIIAGLCSPSIQLRSTFSLFNVGNDRHSLVSPSDNSGLPMLASTDSHQYPILVEQMIYRTQQEKTNYQSTNWTFKDVLVRLLDIMSSPVRTRIENIYNRRSCLNYDSTHNVNQSLVDNCCHLLDRVLAEIIYYTTTNETDTLLAPSRTLYSTGSRFSRSDLSRTWNTGNFGPDAIAFSVDRPGISIVGVMAFSGSGSYEYQMDLLCDNSEEGQSQHKWETLLSTSGSYDQAAVTNDIVEIKFYRPIPIKENTRYSLRLCTHGARTCSGDGGLASVRGPCGTNFYFYTCDLSFNGTTCQRGQIPSILYYSSPLKNNNSNMIHSNNLLNMKAIENNAREVALQIASDVVKKCADILVLTRNAVAVLSSPSDNSSSHTHTVDSEHNITPIEEHMDIDWTNNARKNTKGDSVLPIRRDLSKRFESFSKGLIETLRFDKASPNPFDTEIEIGATEIHPRDLIYEEAVDLSDFSCGNGDFAKLNGNEHVEDVIHSEQKLFPILGSDSDYDNFESLNEVFNKPFSKMFHSLLPLVFAHVSNLAFKDPKSSIQILKLVKDILPHVSALNQLFFAKDSNFDLDFEKRLERIIIEQKEKLQLLKRNRNLDMITTSNHYCIVESEHPYRSASVNSYRVEFPTCVQWLTIEFDPKSGTAQPEDNLLISIPEKYQLSDDLGRPLPKQAHATCLNQNFDGPDIANCLENCGKNYLTTYEHRECDEKDWILVKKITNASEWPQNIMVLPGNCVEFSLETSSLYAQDPNLNRYGFKCLIVGYDNPLNISQNNSCLMRLEQELSHLGGMCSAYLMKKDLKLPDDKENDDASEIEETISKHQSLLSKGFAISEPFLTIQQALEPQLPIGSQSNERQFLKDFVSGAPGSSGGRLASWLQPEPRLDPNKCELTAITEPLRCGWPAQITILIRDQYGDPILVPELKVEIKAIPTGNANIKMRRASSIEDSNPMKVNYEPTIKDKMRFKAITFMKAYSNFSFEELRYNTPTQSRVTEILMGQDMEDGSFVAQWTPNATGHYCLTIIIDGILLEEVHRVEVQEGGQVPPIGKQNIKRSPISNKLRLFYTQNTAGLRIRAHPTLQSEQVGIIKLHGLISFIDEIDNDDGIWLRLSTESIRQHCKMGWYPTEAWCLQYNQHIDKTFLHPVTDETQSSNTAVVNEETDESIPFEGAKNAETADNESDEIEINTAACAESDRAIKTDDDSEPQLSNSSTNPFLNPRLDREQLPDTHICFPESEESTSNREEILKSNVTPSSSPSNIGSAIAGVVGEGASKLQALQKWLKGDPSELSSSSKPVVPRRVPDVGEIASVSVKDLVKAIGGQDGKSNGNGETKCAAPAKQRDIKLRYPYENVVPNENPYDFNVAAIKIVNFTPSQKAALLSTPKHSPRKHPKSSKDPKMNSRKTDPLNLEEENSLLQITTTANEFGETTKDQILIDQPKTENEIIDINPENSSATLQSKINQNNLNINSKSTVMMGPIKRAMPPSFAESIRAVFAAFLWHEGIVHDAMACASFLKFHPSMPKEGAMVMTRRDHNDSRLHLTKEQKAQQRHSVEVANAGTYLNVRPSTLETLTKRGNSSQNNRKHRKTFVADSVDYDQNSKLHSFPEVVTVLPPSLRCLVFLWEQICTSCVHIVQTNNFDRDRASTPLPENNSEMDQKEKNVLKDKDVKKPKKKKREDGSWCEICEVYLPIPVTYHMRVVHPGCGKPAKGKGYNSVGVFCEGWAGNCGEGGKGASSWFLMCDICREKYISANKSTVKVKHVVNITNAENDIQIYDVKSSSLLINSEVYTVMKDNANFLLELAPISSDKSSNNVGEAFSNLSVSNAFKRASHQMPVVIENQHLSNNDLNNKPSTSSADVVRNTRQNHRKSSANSTPKRKSVFGDSSMELNDNSWEAPENFACLRAFGVNSQDELPYEMFNFHLTDIGLDRPASQVSYDPSESHNYEVLVNSSSTQANSNNSTISKFHRSVSMGQGWNLNEQHQTNLINVNPNKDEQRLPKVVYRRRINSISANDGSLLMCYPSDNLRKLVPENMLSSSYIHAVSPKLDYSSVFEVNDGRSTNQINKDAPNFDAVSANFLIERPTMMFIMQKHNLDKLRYAMQRSLRIAACRIYSLQALNWLLRSVTQAICLHDLMWWFVSALNTPSGDLVVSKNEESEISLEHPVSYTQISGKFSVFVTECLHIFLQSVADITLHLPLGSPLQRMAIQCFGIRFRQADHQFLHNSHVFGNISKILSKSEEESDEKLNPLTKVEMREDSGASMDNERNNQKSLYGAFTPPGGRIVQYVDLNGMFDVNVSSRPAMIESLTDNSTETFWESDEDDRNKCKVIEIFLHRHNYVCKTILVHIDNSRDIQNKVQNIIFYSGQSIGDTYLIKAVEVDQKACTWISAKVCDENHSYFRLELHGQENTLRVRQIKLLGLARPSFWQDEESNAVINESSAHQKTLIKSNIKLFYANRIQHQLCEAETLRVFRLITGQVFGKLISTANDEDRTLLDFKMASSNSSALADSLDLREHMVGILFSRSKLSHLQKQVIVHIVYAIKKEAQRAKDDWETSNLSNTLKNLQNNNEIKSESSSERSRGPDTYCFEMLSMVLALSGSAVGRTYLSHQHGLLKDLLSLLHTGSDRVQRQVIALLRRILPEISPENFAELLGISQLPQSEYSIVQQHSGEFDMNRLGLLDIFLAAIAKSLQLQVKVKNSAQKGNNEKTPSFIRLANSLDLSVYLMKNSNENGHSEPLDQEIKLEHDDDDFDLDKSTSFIMQPMMDNIENIENLSNQNTLKRQKPDLKRNLNHRWFLHGVMSSKQAENIIHLVRDMASGKLSEKWSKVTKSAIAEAVLNLTRLDEVFRTPEHCIKTATLWLALSSLCVLDREHVEKLSSAQWSKLTDSRPMCSNHDDGETTAVIECESCGSLCNDCDRYLHLNRKTRYHKRTVCKEEEEAIRVELHESCGRIRLFWLLALADSKTLKAMVEFRDGSHTIIAGPSEAIGRCRFCGITGNSGLLEIGNVCADPQCQEYAANSCMKIKTCGHPCGGVTNETKCLPCLQHECHPKENELSEEQGEPKLTQDADDMCMICFIEALSCAPSIQLDCGHVFHYHCCQAVLEKRWVGPRITFGFSLCPICKADMQHNMLEDILNPINSLKNDVTRKALMRIKYEGIVKESNSKDLTALAMDRYAYYVCFKCQKAYYGGEARCDAEIGEKFDPEELVCGGCSDVARAKMCPKHGTDFLEYKCRYCCSVAVFFCFGTTHFCDTCHDDFQRLTNIPKNKLPQCPAGPKANQLMGEECPLHIIHPPTGEEFALGCGVCRNAQTF